MLTRKIIQLVIEEFNAGLYVVCDDGTIWRRGCGSTDDWVEQKNVPPPEPVLKVPRVEHPNYNKGPSNE